MSTIQYETVFGDCNGGDGGKAATSELVVAKGVALEATVVHEDGGGIGRHGEEAIPLYMVSYVLFFVRDLAFNRPNGFLLILQAHPVMRMCVLRLCQCCWW